MKMFPDETLALMEHISIEASRRKYALYLHKDTAAALLAYQEAVL